MDDHEEDLETLGEQLYTLIYSKHKEDAGKLTGEEACLLTVNVGQFDWMKWWFLWIFYPFSKVYMWCYPLILNMR